LVPVAVLSLAAHLLLPPPFTRSKRCCFLEGGEERSRSRKNQVERQEGEKGGKRLLLLLVLDKGEPGVEGRRRSLACSLGVGAFNWRQQWPGRRQLQHGGIHKLASELPAPPVRRPRPDRLLDHADARRSMRAAGLGRRSSTTTGAATAREAM